MSAFTDQLILELIKNRYQPYDAHEEFHRGFSSYRAGDTRNPHQAESASALAWDCGVEAAKVYERATIA